MGNACRHCAAGLPHCHGTLIHHPTGQRQCTEPDCAHPEVVLHSLTVDCDALGCQCAEGDGELAAM
ncbi:MAG: hypothetical protein WCH82_01075 [Mycobacteriaceae bacterium]